MRLSNVVSGFGVVALAAIAGCGSSSTPTSNGGGGGSAAGPGCALSAAGCKTDISNCVALVDNKGKKNFGLRISQLTVNSPAALSGGAIATVVNNAVASNYSACTIGAGTSDSVYGTGTGTFSWLLQVDETAGTLKTGGAKPVADPVAGYCFVNDKAAGIVPFSVPSAVSADGKFSMTDGQDLTVPIYLDAAANSVVLLPLHKARLFNGTISSDNNCIGKYNAEGLDPVNTCKAEPENKIYAFVNDASLEGYMTIEEADKVEIEALANESLCVLLAGQDDGATPKRCPKTGVKGDWCSTTNTAGGCADSYHLGATFAASAVTISGDCK